MVLVQKWPFFQLLLSLVTCVPRPGKHISLVICVPAPGKDISLVMCSPTWETHIPSDMSSPTWETHIPSDVCSTAWETHIPRDMCYPTCIPKGLTNAFGLKMAIFSSFFLGNISQENVFTIF